MLHKFAFVKKLIIYIFILPFISCNSEEIERILSSLATDGWSSYRPLTIYAYPFKPEKSWDPESLVGNLLWLGTNKAIEDFSENSNGKVVYKGFSKDDRNSYQNILNSGPIYGFFEKPDADKRQILSKECNHRNVEALTWGLYSATPENLRISVFLYVKKDNLSIKDRDTVQMTEIQAKNLVYAIKNDVELTSSQEYLVLELLSKSQNLTSNLLQRYTSQN